MSLSEYIVVRESGRDRLRPRLSHSRWYVLNNITDWIETVVEKFGRECPHARIIDLGCGEQTYRAQFEAADMHYHGVDLPGNERAESLFSGGGATTVADGSYDLALSISVLEHVDDPAAYLDEAHRVLRPNGHLVLATHGIWIYHPDPGDFWRWTCDGLQRQIEEAGFKIIDFRGSVGLAAAGFHLVQDSFLRKIRQLHWPILGRLLRVGVPLYTVFFQSLIAWADSLSNDHNRRSDAMGFFVVARAEQIEGAQCSDGD